MNVQVEKWKFCLFRNFIRMPMQKDRMDKIPGTTLSNVIILSKMFVVGTFVIS